MLLVYEDLRQLAKRYVRHDPGGATLGATGLVHEAWIKIRKTLGCDSVRTFNQREYYAILAQAMRRILVDRARKKKSQRHGGRFVRVEFYPNDTALPTNEFDFIAFSNALDRLEVESPIHAEIVSLKFFADRTNDQVGEMLERSPHWIRRQWTYAKARLLHFVESE